MNSFHVVNSVLMKELKIWTAEPRKAVTIFEDANEDPLIISIPNNYLIYKDLKNLKAL